MYLEIEILPGVCFLIFLSFSEKSYCSRRGANDLFTLQFTASILLPNCQFGENRGRKFFLSRLNIFLLKVWAKKFFFVNYCFFNKIFILILIILFSRRKKTSFIIVNFIHLNFLKLQLFLKILGIIIFSFNYLKF